MEFEFFGLKVSRERELEKKERVFIVFSAFYFFILFVSISRSFGMMSLASRGACGTELASTLDVVSLSKQCLADVLDSARNFDIAIEQAYIFLHWTAFYFVSLILLKILRWTFK